MTPLYGRYEVLRILGKGGAGSVFLVEDLFLHRRKLALKRIVAHAGELLRRSFEHEFSLISSLNIPGVVPVVDFGLEPASSSSPARPYFTRSYVPGATLGGAARLLEANKLLEVFATTCAIVADLHAQGIAHGDLKPANVIVDPQVAPHLIDLGLAAPFSALAHHRPVGGTRSFMAPELFEGKAPGVLSDIYALGVMLQYVLEERTTWSDRELVRRVRSLASQAAHATPEARVASAWELAVSLRRLLGLPVADVRISRSTVRIQRHTRLIQDVEEQLQETQPLVQGSFILLSGAPGAGKSTLCLQLKWRLQLLHFDVLEFGASRLPGRKSLDGLAETLWRMRNSGREADHVGLSLGEELRFRHAEAPLVLIYEDADAEELAVAQELQRLASEHSLRVVATAADDAFINRLNLSRRQIYRIPALAESEIKEMGASLELVLSDSLATSIARRTEGIFQQVLEVLRLLKQGGVATEREVESLSLSSTLAASLSTQLDQLTAEETDVLKLVLLLSGDLSYQSLMVACSDALSLSEDRVEAQVDRLERRGLVVREHGRVRPRSPWLAGVPALRLKERAAELLIKPSSDKFTLASASLALVSEREDLILEIIPSAADTAFEEERYSRAAELYQVLAEMRHVRGWHHALLRLARSHLALGEYASAIQEADLLLATQEGQSIEAAVTASRAHAAIGAYDQAVRGLTPLLDEAPTARERGMICVELAKVNLRRGAYSEARQLASRGLSEDLADVSLVVELLTTAGMSASYLGQHTNAAGHYQDAAALAERSGQQRDELIASTYLAIEYQRQGELGAAKGMHEKCLKLAQELADFGSLATVTLNLGTVKFQLGMLSEASEAYRQALVAARRAGKINTVVYAANNLAYWNVYVGLYESAKGLAEDSKLQAEERGLRSAAAQAFAVLAEANLRSRVYPQAQSQYQTALEIYKQLGLLRERAELILDLRQHAADGLWDAQSVDDEQPPLDALFEEAKEVVRNNNFHDLERRLDLFEANTASSKDGAMAMIEKVLQAARAEGERELEWRALVARAQVHEQLGQGHEAEIDRQVALSVVQSLASALSPDCRESFWRNKARAELAEAVDRSTSQLPCEASSADGRSADGRSADGRSADGRFGEQRMLEVFALTRSLALEGDQAALLQKVTRSAYRLFEASRAVLLLLENSGQLAPTALECASPDVVANASTDAYSRSIAEAVVGDAEAIITSNATVDPRLAEYESVHLRRLQSVAAFPVRSRSGVLGVLYLEREHAFSSLELALLSAYSDHAAVAVETLRLLEQEKRREAALEQAHVELQLVNRELEGRLTQQDRNLKRARDELRSLRVKASPPDDLPAVMGNSVAVRQLRERCAQLASMPISVVILGDNGTGKEQVAQYLHTLSEDPYQPFVVLEPGAVPDSLIEAQLFGYERGAFSGAEGAKVGILLEASGGTLYLNDVASMSLRMQTALLRAIENGQVYPLGSSTPRKVDLRVVSSLSEPAASLVQSGRLREDLYFRLAGLTLEVPSLAQRKKDLPVLCAHYLAVHAKKLKRQHLALTAESLRLLARTDLSGNLRQLEQTLLRAAALSRDGVLTEEALRAQLSVGAIGAPTKSGRPPRDEKAAIVAALQACHGNKAQAAKCLDMPRRTLYRRLKQHNLL